MVNEKVNLFSVPEFKDEPITCIVCGSSFVFEKGEAEFFYKHEYTPPKRCPMCRKWKRYNQDSKRGMR